MDIPVPIQVSKDVRLMSHIILQVGETLLKMAVDEISGPTQIVDASENIKEMNSVATSLDDQSSVIGHTKIGGVLSTPAVRNLAKQYGVDINVVPGTGKDGRILKEDVLKYAGIIEKTPAFSSPAGQSQSEDEKYPKIPISQGLDYEDKTIPLRYLFFFGFLPFEIMKINTAIFYICSN